MQGGTDCLPANPCDTPGPFTDACPATVKRRHPPACPPDCNAIKIRRQATGASGDFVAHHGLADSVARHFAPWAKAVDDGRCTNTSPAGLIRFAALALRGLMRRFATARRRRATVLALQSLDTHTLRDLGLHRSEIPSAVAELLGEVDVARTRFVQRR